MKKTEKRAVVWACLVVLWLLGVGGWGVAWGIATAPHHAPGRARVVVVVPDPGW